MVLWNRNSLGIRKKHIRIGNKFDCVEGVTYNKIFYLSVQNAKNQEILVVCTERKDTEAYFGGSKPLNHLQMIDF